MHPARTKGGRPDSAINPDYAGALGATVDAAFMAEDHPLDNLVMTDVPVSADPDRVGKTAVGVRMTQIVSDCGHQGGSPPAG